MQLSGDSPFTSSLIHWGLVNWLAVPDQSDAADRFPDVCPDATGFEVEILIRTLITNADD